MCIFFLYPSFGGCLVIGISVNFRELKGEKCILDRCCHLEPDRLEPLTGLLSNGRLLGPML
jgi:hypothetical protein